jgi:hypothetical protein
MPSIQIRRLLRDAAGTICQLNDDLQRANAENDELRELVYAFDWCTENFDMPYRCDQCPLKQTDAIEPECEIRMRKLRIREKQ